MAVDVCCYRYYTFMYIPCGMHSYSINCASFRRSKSVSCIRCPRSIAVIKQLLALTSAPSCAQRYTTDPVLAKIRPENQFPLGLKPGRR